MSKSLAAFFAALVKLGTMPMRPYRRTITRALTAERLRPVVTRAVLGVPIRFVGSSARSLHDPLKLLEREPETIRWLDGLPEGETLWDIGANVGVYSLYGAMVRKLRVLAFEPSGATYADLVRNVELNGCDRAISAYCIAFDERTHLDFLHMAHTEAGHSRHGFGGLAPGEHAVFRQAVPGFSIDGFCELFDPPPPQHIKLDVDGIELKILRGAAHTLASHVQSVLVEIEGPERERLGAEIASALGAAGLLEDKAFMAEGAERNVLFRRAGGKTSQA